MQRVEQEVWLHLQLQELELRLCSKVCLAQQRDFLLSVLANTQDDVD